MSTVGKEGGMRETERGSEQGREEGREVKKMRKSKQQGIRLGRMVAYEHSAKLKSINFFD